MAAAKLENWDTDEPSQRRVRHLRPDSACGTGARTAGIIEE
jgi:hypothetical protein